MLQVLAKLMSCWEHGLHIPSRKGPAVRQITFIKNLIYFSGEDSHFQRMKKRTLNNKRKFYSVLALLKICGAAVTMCNACSNIHHLRISYAEYICIPFFFSWIKDIITKYNANETCNRDVFFVRYGPECCVLYSLCIGLTLWRVGSCPIRVCNTVLDNKKIEFSLY